MERRTSPDPESYRFWYRVWAGFLLMVGVTLLALCAWAGVAIVNWITSK